MEIYPYYAPILGASGPDLNAEKILTVHHSKYALARHRWDEPLKNAMNLKEKDFIERVDAYYRGSGPVKIMSNIDYNTPGNTAIDELLTEIYIPIENKSKIIC